MGVEAITTTYKNADFPYRERERRGSKITEFTLGVKECPIKF